MHFLFSAVSFYEGLHVGVVQLLQCELERQPPNIYSSHLL